MLEAAVSQYNWGYLDAIEQPVDIRTFWLFMLWRLITLRFVERFLQFWGFVTFDRRRFYQQPAGPDMVQLQPLLTATFAFEITKVS